MLARTGDEKGGVKELVCRNLEVAFGGVKAVGFEVGL